MEIPLNLRCAREQGAWKNLSRPLRLLPTGAHEEFPCRPLGRRPGVKKILPNATMFEAFTSGTMLDPLLLTGRGITVGAISVGSETICHRARSRDHSAATMV
jgi:hypothetical protein